jgi:YfiH family protein
MQEADVIFPQWPGLPANVAALATTRHGGLSTAPFDSLNLGQHVGDDPQLVARNRAQLGQRVPYPIAWLNQVHGVAVADAAKVVAAQAIVDADACIATEAGAACVVMTADCLPVLFADVNGKVVGAAHAGWRGLAAGVLGKTVQAMRAAGAASGAGEITAWLGPAIGPQQFEVGGEVLDAFAATAIDAAEKQLILSAFKDHPASPGKHYADIYALARCLLRRDGVRQVFGGEHCTVSETNRFFSYRRDGKTGRQASLIWLK